MNEEKKKKARERVKKYYLEHKEEILKKQAAYKKKKYHSMSPEEKQTFLEKRREIMKRYRSRNKEKFKEYNRKYKAKKIEQGKIPKTKKMIIEELQQENQRLKIKLNTNERAIEAANKVILDCLLSEEYIKLDGEYLSVVFFELTKILNTHNNKEE